MKVLICHTRYQQAGGEDQVFEAEEELLRERGHEVIRHERRNDEVAHMGRAALARATLWNSQAHREMAAVVAEHRPQIVQFHNTFPLMSPACYYAARSQGAAVVQTLHNYRLLCPNALLFRDGKVCETCVGRKIPWPAVAHKCYRGSCAASAGAAAMLVAHRAMGTWKRAVDAYIALTEFSRQRFLQGGLPPDKLFVKPNFLDPDPGPGLGGGGYALYVGRLSEEKGLATLLAAWRLLKRKYKLVIVGDGPLRGQVERAAAEGARIEWRGRRPTSDVLSLMGGADCVVVPSHCYENFPRTIVEAMSRGTPVVAARLGAMQELTEHGRTGLLFAPQDAADLARQVEALFALPEQTAAMRTAARRQFEQRYTADANHEVLMQIYRRALATRTAAAPVEPAAQLRALPVERA
jgi:glycosyltransferase involved in cell wall biosynthesis